MISLSTHVLDTGTGTPAAGVLVIVRRGDEVVAERRTDEDGRARLADALDRFDNIAAVVHGHAHHGAYEGRTMRGTPVYNCAQFVLREKFGKPYAVFEV